MCSQYWSSLAIVAVCLGSACSDESNPPAATVWAPVTEAPDAMVADPAPSPAQTCTLPDYCQDLDTLFFVWPACCTAATPCGYALDVPEEFFDVYPQARDLQAELTVDDPEGRCVPDHFVFSVSDGQYKHRVEEDDGDFVLITPDCESRTMMVHTLPGCCMPNNECGVSTDETWHTLGAFVPGESYPFTEMECVAVSELNRQLKESPLAAFARIPETTTRPCDYAALEAELPPFTQ